MVKRTGAYREIVAHVFMGADSMGRPKIQVRPVAGQGIDAKLNIECARKLREEHPIGTRFRIRVQLTDMDGTRFLYSYFGWPVELLR